MAMRRTRTRVHRGNWPRRSPSRKVARPWSRDEIAFMRKFYRNYETAWIARQLRRTVYSVRYKAVDLNIKKANPSVWKGNTGGPSTFKRKTRKGHNFPSMNRKTRPHRSPRTWKSHGKSTRRIPRRSKSRRTSRRI